MDPLSVLLAFLAGAALADDARAKKINYERDDLHRKLGIHGTLPPIGPSIDSRLRWITRTYGPEIGWLARRAAILWGQPWYSHRSYADIGPLLPWLAWRWSKGDATELRRVLTEEATEWIPGHLQFHSNKATEEAYATLHYLTDWLARAQPNLTRLTWDEALVKEWAWSKTQVLKTYTLKNLRPELSRVGPGDLVFRFPVENEEEAPWILTCVAPFENYDKLLLEGHLNRDGSRYITQRAIPNAASKLYILWNHEREPTVFLVVDTVNNLRRIIGAHGESIFDWDPDFGSPSSDGEAILDHLKIAARYIQPDLRKWHDPGSILLAFLDLSEDEAISLIHRLPELLNRDTGISSVIMERGEDWYGPRFLQAWADAVNTDYSQEEYRFSDSKIAQRQWPSMALSHWIEANDFSLSLDPKLSQEPASLEDLPAVFEVLEPGEEEIDINPEEEPQPPIWAIRLHDLFEHPSGARLEVRIEVLVVYSPLGNEKTWQIVRNKMARFHPGTPDASWEESWDHWVPIEPVVKTRRGLQILNPDLTHDPREYASARGWGVFTGHRSLDVALQRAWRVLEGGLRLDELPSTNWQHFFPKGLDLLDPPESIRVADLRAWAMAAPER